ncbi:MAG: 50S ribosomal protein L35 [Deltaproteobacteria bacterium]|nr:50S ribosomal protein L35 [Deltaproteobacteria bacterium]
MPKMKTNSGAAKRFKVTGSGKIKRAKSGTRHLLNSKNRNRKRRLKEDSYVESANMRNIKMLLPNA